MALCHHGCVLTNNTRLGSKAKASLPLGWLFTKAWQGTETEPDSLSYPSPPPHVPSSRLLAVCQGARAMQLSSYGPEKNFMPEKELRSHRKLEYSSLDLCPARKSAWYARLIIGNLFVFCLKRVVVVWYDPDLVYVVLCFQPLFPQLDCIHVGCTSLSVWEHDCVSGHKDKSRQHQGRTPLPPCSTFWPKVGIWTAAAALPKGLIFSAYKHNYCMNMPITFPTPTCSALLSLITSTWLVWWAMPCA